jgi:hypothetical protein
MKNWKKKLGELSFTKGYYFKMGDNGLVEKKDDQLIFTRKELEHFIEQELDRVREEGRKELLDSIIEGIKRLKDLVLMFNPMSPEIRAKQSGEIEAYNGLLEKLSKLTTK